MTRLAAWWDSLRSSFWFIPSVGLALGFVLSTVLVWIDREFLGDQVEGTWLATTPAASRSILSSLSGALISVTALVFSITMLTLSQTASSYGGRLLRTFLDRALPQVTLAAFLGTAIYAIRVLRTVREVEAVAFSPHLSTAVAIGMFLGCVCLLIAFINYTATMLQPPNILQSVSEDLTEAIERIYPTGVAEPPGVVPHDTSFPGASRHSIRLGRVGYLQGIDEDELLEAAEELGGIIRLRVRPGLFVGSKTVVAEILPESAATDELCEKIEDTFILGADRTPRQDVEAAILELVEVAARALSPGINDPRTAITATHYLSDAFVRLADRQFPCEERFVDEELRLVLPRERFDAMLSAAFTAILHYAGDFGPNIEAVLEGCQRINEAICLAEESDDPPSDLDAKRTAIAQMVELIAHKVGQNVEGPSQRLLLDECKTLTDAITDRAKATSLDGRDADAMATAMQAVSEESDVEKQLAVDDAEAAEKAIASS